MPYIGNTPALDYISFAVQNFTVTAGTTVYTLDYSVSNENDIALYINSVAQRPGSSFAYSATGTTLTLTSATLATDTMYAVFIGRAVQTVTPAAGSVTNTMLSPSVITGQTAETSIAGGDLVLLYDDSATALRKMTKTNLFSGISNTPAFFAQSDTGQTAANNTATQITYNLEVYDTDNCFASSIFTPNVAGKYFCYASVPFESNFNSDQLLFLSKNSTVGNSANTTLFYTRATFNMNVMASFDMNGTTDTIRVFIQQGSGTTQNVNFGGNRQYAYFGAFRILGA